MGSLSADIIMRARGLAIIAVVWGHVNPGFGPQVGHFHMPLFFFVGGIVMTADRSVRQVARFVAVDLLLYAALWTFLYSLVAFVLAPLGLKFQYFSDFNPSHYTIDILRHNGHHVSLALTAWFLYAYASAVVICETLIRVLPKAVHGWLLPLLGIALFWLGVEVFAQGYHETKHWLWNAASHAAVGSSYMLLGYSFARVRWRDVSLTHPLALVAVWLVYCWVAFGFKVPGIGMVQSSFGAGLVLSALVSGLGVMALMQLATVLNQPAFGWLASIGKVSKQVMMHHLFVFTLLNLGFVTLGLMSIADLTGPYSKWQLAWTWPLYFCLGVIVPWLTTLAYRRWKASRRVAAAA